MDSSPPHTPSPTPPGEPARPARVLLVDDDPASRRAVADLLTSRFSGVVPEEITDHVAFFRALQTIDFDLVVTDHRLHWSSGLEVLSAVKSLRPTIPVILHAAVDDPAEVDEALQAGLHAFIPKGPGQEGTLGAAVRSALQIVEFEDQVVSEQERYRVVLENANAQYRAIFEAVSAATVIVDEDLTVTMVNPAFEQLSGYARDEAEERKAFTEFIASSDLERVREIQRRRRAADVTLPHSYEVSFVHRSGRLLQVRVNEALLPGTRRIVASLLDLTPHREAEAELLHSAFHDALTGLANRFQLLDRVEDLLATADPGDELAVVVLDLDRFELVNRAWGTRVGDALLRAVADRLRTTVLEADLLARVDGDAFAVLLHPLVHRGEARSVATVIHESLRQPFALGEVSLVTPASIGVAWRDDAGSADELLRRADAARVRAKALGGDRWAPFEPSLLGPAGPELARSQGLRRSLETSELAVGFQPLVDPTTARVVAVHAVLPFPDRPETDWERAAAKAGLLTLAGQHLLRRTCEHLRRLREVRPDLVAVVRIPRSHLELDELPREVDRLVGGVGLPGRAVAVAIPAQWFSAHDPTLATLVGSLTAGGVAYTVDDYRGLLRGLPDARPFAVCLDPDLLAGIGEDPTRWALAEAVVGRATTHGVPVVARGVEDVSHVERLRAVGCSWFEAPLLAGPLDLEATLELLQRG